MKNKTTKLTAVALLLALGSMAVNADPTLNPANGHYYDVIAVPAGTDWNTAEALAKLEFFSGVQGHLATITSADENTFIDTLRPMAAGELWVGGFQVPCENPEEDFDCGWEWINGEGPFDYTNWSAGEPNNLGGMEDHLGIFLGSQLGWNDEGNFNNIRGIMVEFSFSGTVGGGACVVKLNPLGCNPSGVQTVELSIEAPSGSTISQGLVKPAEPAMHIDCPGVFAMRDERVDVDTAGIPVGLNSTAPLNVFFKFPGPGGNTGDLMLDEHTYGSPCFAVLKGSAVDFDLPEGAVVESEQIPFNVPGIGNIFDCHDPDLQRRTQFTYQTGNKFDMEEETAAAMTSSCNSPSRGGSFRFSYFILNTHEDCGILDFDMAGNPSLVLQCFTDLAIAKYDLLEQVILRSQGNVNSRTFKKIRSKFNQARSMTKTSNYTKADARLKALLGLVEGATWTVALGENDPGNMIMRINNLIFRNEQLNEAAGNPPLS